MKFKHVIIFSILFMSVIQSCADSKETVANDESESATTTAEKTPPAEEDASFTYEFSKQATFFSDLESGKVIDELGMNNDQLESAHPLAMKKQSGNIYYMSIDGKVINGEDGQPKVWIKEKGERSFFAKTGEQVLYPLTENNIYFFAPPSAENKVLTIKYMK